MNEIAGSLPPLHDTLQNMPPESGLTAVPCLIVGFGLKTSLPFQAWNNVDRLGSLAWCNMPVVGLTFTVLNKYLPAE